MGDALMRMDLTAAQGRIIGYLAHHPDAPCARDIEEAFQLSHPTVSGLLSRMERKGFLEFSPDPRDHRCKRIYLLPRGRDCHIRIAQTIVETEQTMVSGFSPEEQAQFAAFLNRAIINMGGSPYTPFSKEEHYPHD